MTDLVDVAKEAVRKRRQRRLKLVVPEQDEGGSHGERIPPSDPADRTAFPGTDDATGIASDVVLSNAKLALEGYQRAVRQAGLGPGDPLLPLLQAMGGVAMAVGEAADAMPARLDAVIERADHAAATQLEAARVAGESERAGALRKMADGLAPLVSKAVARGTRRFDAMLAISVGGGLAIAVLLAAAGGYAYARWTLDGEARATEASLSAAFSGGVAAAGEWEQLVRANAGAAPVALCKDGRAQHGANKDGRRWCAVPLWLDQAKPEAPK